MYNSRSNLSGFKGFFFGLSLGPKGLGPRTPKVTKMKAQWWRITWKGIHNEMDAGYHIGIIGIAYD